MRFRTKDKWAIFLIFAILVMSIWFISSYINHGFIYSLIQGDTTSLTDIISNFGMWSYLIFILLIVLEAVFAPIPPLILYIVRWCN